ncbi:hypothetical protein NW754_004689 [Fusarium falciforme]|nr:hypothetical protein NW754_004689 [Fusarium falciforme]
MEIAGLALSAVSAGPVLAEYGYRIYRRVEDKRRLAPLAQELSVFALDDRKDQLTLIIELARPVSEAAPSCRSTGSGLSGPGSDSKNNWDG